MQDSGTRARPSYQSWNYYHSDFGLYDDDEEIVTLDQREFKESVLHGYQVWFVNFYSPRCGHCHDLAPEWRALARDLQGTGVRGGAVNCGEEPGLCRGQGVQGYPSLLLYTLGEGTRRFQGSRHHQPLLEFLSLHLEDTTVTLWDGNWERWREAEPGPWVVALCRGEACPPVLTRQLVGGALEGLARLGVVECGQDPGLCDRLGEAGLLYLPGGLAKPEGGLELTSSMEEHQDICAGGLHPFLILARGTEPRGRGPQARRCRLPGATSQAG